MGMFSSLLWLRSRAIGAEAGWQRRGGFVVAAFGSGEVGFGRAELAAGVCGDGGDAFFDLVC